MNHPSDTLLERFSVGDLAPADRDSSQAHVNACATCRGYLAALSAAHQDLLAAVPPARFVAQVVARQRRTTWRRLTRSTAAVAVLSMAAMLALLLRPPDVRWKGNGFVVERQRGGVVTRLGPDLQVRAGDTLRIIAVMAHAAPVSVWFVDVRGRVDELFDGPQEVAVGAHALPNSVTVDAPCVDSWIVLGTGENASPRAVAALRAQVRGGIPHSDGVPAWLPAGALIERLRCE